MVSLILKFSTNAWYYLIFEVFSTGIRGQILFTLLFSSYDTELIGSIRVLIDYLEQSRAYFVHPVSQRASPAPEYIFMPVDRLILRKILKDGLYFYIHSGEFIVLPLFSYYDSSVEGFGNFSEVCLSKVVSKEKIV